MDGVRADGEKILSGTEAVLVVGSRILSQRNTKAESSEAV